MAFNSNWLDDWAKRIEITIDHTLVDEELTDFPLFLNIRNTSGINGANPMQDLKDELSVGDYDFSDDFTEGLDIKTWNRSQPGVSTIAISGTKLVATATTLGANAYPWTGGVSRWNHRSTTFSMDTHYGWTPSATDSVKWRIYFIVRDKDNTADYSRIEFNYEPAAYGGSTPMRIRSRSVNGGATDYGTSTYHDVTTFKGRISRSGTTISLYYDVGGGWVLIDSTTCSNWGANVEVYHTLYNDDFASGDTTAVMWIDEFIVNTGSIYHYYARKKMAMTDEDGTQCPIEIEDLQFRLNRAIMWTKVPTVYADRDTKIYLYYDYTKADNTTYVGELGEAAARNVWDSDYVAVYHMENRGSNPSGANSVEDSTTFANHGTPVNTPNLLTAKAGRGLNFDGSSERVNLGSGFTDLNGKSKLTVSVVMKSDEIPFTAYRGVIGIGGSNQRTPWVYCNSGSPHVVFYCELADSSVITRTVTNLSVDTWHAVDFVWTGTELRRYKDGEWGGSAVSTNASTVATSDGLNYLAFIDTYSYFDGILDEIRISKTDRSSAYIKASKHSTWDELAYYSNEQLYPPGYLSGTVYDKYGRPMAEPCSIIVSDTDGDFVTAATSSGNGVFNIGVPAPFDEHFIVTFYKQGNYGLDHNIAGAMFMTPVSGTGS